MWGAIARFHVRDDLYLERGRIDTAALSPVGRLAAEYTYVENAFTTPLPEETLAVLNGKRMRRIDGLDTDFPQSTHRSGPRQDPPSALSSGIGDVHRNHGC
ncbi:hypothetical protein AB0323_12810 [Arthrobacter sp. NPDC080031]|uniref:hypothetical protein n=1 Tax=Arthrobacter sp. NPDC080031 TaxID=3155918 RepID=UPI003451089B